VPSALALKGSTEPRLFTPPLRELTPETSWGFECIEFLEKVLRWTLLPWQKWLYIHALEKDESGFGFRFETIVLLIARQNGKTQWLKGLGLWRMYMDGAKQVLISAQTLEIAETTLAEVVADVRSNPLLRKEYRRFSQTNGKVKLILKPLDPKVDPLQEPREWRAAVSGIKGGRSLSMDLVLLDELRLQHNWLAWNAITPTTTAVARSLVVGASNAGDENSVVLRSLRDGAIAKILTKDTNTQTFLSEWSIPDDADYTDPQFWPMANPAVGYLPGFTVARLAGKLEAMHDNIPGFRTEHGCQWVRSLAPGIIPADGWKNTTDHASAPAADATIWASLDVNFSRSVSYAAIWGRREDGDGHMEVVHAERGTDWIIPWFTQRRNDFQGVVIQARGAPASDFIEPLREADVPVMELGGANLTAAYGKGYDAIVEGWAYHRPSPALDEAAAAAQAKKLGDAWVVDRWKSPTDASPLVACIQAAAGELVLKSNDVEVWGLVV
jgi:hypothetical protein